MKNASLSKFSVLLSATLFLAACAEKELILPGERIAVTAFEEDLLAVNSEAASEDFGLPAAVANTEFSAPGQSVDHAGGHYLVELPLKRVFSKKIGVAAENGTELAQPVANETAIFTIMPGGVITATDAKTGDVIWTKDIDPSEDETQTSTSGGIALAGNDLAVHASKNALYLLNASNGEEIWELRTDVFLSDGPSINAGIVMVTDLDGRLYAFSQADADLLWSRIGAQDATRITGSTFPAINGNEVIASGGDGEVLSLDLQSGEFLWGENLTPLQLRTALDGIPDLRAHPIHDGGLVIIATPSKNVIAFSANTGREIWSMPLHALDMPWLAGDTIYLTTIDGRLYALRRRDGAIRWVAELPGAYDPSLAVIEDAVLYTTPIVISGQVFVASSRGKLLGFDAKTGAPTDQISTGKSVTTAPIVANNMVYVINRSGQLIGMQ